MAEFAANAVYNMRCAKPRTMHILLADDEAVLLRSVTEFLQRVRPAWQLTTAADGVEALRILRSESIDLLVTDINMPGMDGLALLEAVRADAALRHLPLILVTALSDRATMRRGMSSGADDYLTKPFTGQELVEAVEVRTRRFEPPPAPDAGDTPWGREHLQKILTAREFEVLALIGQGLVTKDIAARLEVSPNTVSVFRTSIMRKLDLHNAAALAAVAVRAKLS